MKKKIIHKQGDIRFFYQGITLMQKDKKHFCLEVKNGKPSWLKVTKVSGIKIKYNTNGVYGYGLFSGKTLLCSGYWQLKEAKRAARDWQSQKLAA